MRNLTIKVSPEQDELTKSLAHRPCHTRASISAFLKETAEAAVEDVDLQAWSDRAYRAHQANEAKSFGVAPAAPISGSGPGTNPAILTEAERTS